MMARSNNKKASIVVTAGPTRENIDPVRYLSNYSTGIFGYEIAKEAARRGHRTTLISGPTCIESPPKVKAIWVESALEMKAALEKALNGADCLIMAAAVSDWRVARPARKKLKSGSDTMTLELIRNPDILAAASKRRKNGLFIVGFALETEAVEKNARAKLRKKGLDMIVANAIGKRSSPFGDNSTNIMILDRDGGKSAFPGVTKARAAKIILDKAFGFNI